MSRYGTPRSAASPSAVNSSPMPGCATTIRSRGKPSVAAVSSAVKAELANMTSQVRAAFCVLAPVHRARAAGRSTPGGEAARGRGSWSRGAPARCGGYIQSLKWSTSNSPSQRSAGGRRAATRRCASRARRGADRRCSTWMPSSASGIARRPSGDVGANATTSWPSRCAASARPRERAADVVVHAGALVRERADVEGDPHRLRARPASEDARPLVAGRCPFRTRAAPARTPTHQRAGPHPPPSKADDTGEPVTCL